MDQLFELELEFPPKESRQAAHILYEQVRAAIVDGRLLPGARMPPTRHSQRHFGVSRNTMAAVYGRLLRDGFLATRRGSGTYVSAVASQSKRPVRCHSPQLADRRLNAFWLRPDVMAALSFWQEIPSDGVAGAGIDLRPALVDVRLFPFDTFRRISAKRLRGWQNKPVIYRSPQGNQGNRDLRKSIVEHLAQMRSVRCAEDEVVVTSGAQQAFDLLARTLVSSGRTVVAVEDPGYPPMRIAFAAAGAKVVGVPLDCEGIRIDCLPARVGIICVCVHPTSFRSASRCLPHDAPH